MRNLYSGWILAGVLAAAAAGAAEPLKAELEMSRGRVWSGEVTGRDGEWLDFMETGKDKAIRIGAKTIVELRFTIEIDSEAVQKMLENREFKPLITLLTAKLAPFAAYSDIPSNLTRYNFMMMKLYYWNREYDKSLAISEVLSNDERDPQTKEQSRTFRALALIESGQVERAEALLNEYGWAVAEAESVSSEKLYMAAKLLKLKKEYNRAMETVAKVVAFHSEDADWMPQAEMLCAELYAELGMYDSADEVIKQILILYKDTPEYDQAGKLKLVVEKLRAEQKIEKLEEENV